MSGRRPYREPSPLGDILPGLMRGLRPKRDDPLEKLRGAWEAAAGASTAARARLAGFRDGVVLVESASAALRQHLSLFRREEILAALRAAVPDVRIDDLRCRP